ncbi:response regulator [Shouchella patagoniensis]|uniref:response regulator n=1 Tax=Shouchella patagoniensis TaxID=228576 RepID=UPI0009954709|nr:response regulator [Shouchella patagoniensis]
MNVMIAEDDYRVAEIHEQFLKKINNIQVVAKAQTAKETVALAKKHQPDLLLLDVYLPDQLGTDTLIELQQSCPTMQVILITAATEKEIFRSALQHGVADFLVKPIAFERLQSAVSKVEKLSAWLKEKEPIDQSVADQFFQKSNKRLSEDANLPKGIDQLTLQKVRTLLNEQVEGITAEAMGRMFGASRTTSRRYLEYLISIGEAKAELEYGIVGRPERKYWVV